MSLRKKLILEVKGLTRVSVLMAAVRSKSQFSVSNFNTLFYEKDKAIENSFFVFDCFWTMKTNR